MGHMRKSKQYLLQYGLALVAATLSGCSTPSFKVHDGLINRLNNRGPVALSSENPYLAANLLVTREMKNSPEIQGFVRHRGAPSAIEVQKEYFSPLLLQFYYPETREYFSLEDADGTWIIRGPIVMNREKFKEVARLTRGLSGDPLVQFPTEEPLPQGNDPFNKQTAQTKNEQSATKGSDPFIERLQAYEKAQSVRQQKSAMQPFRSASTAGPSLESIITEEAKYDAELSPKGDLVHYVTFPGETLSMIARWYTRDRNNAGRLARINRLENPNSLTLGDVIIIPTYLLKNKKRLTEEAVTKLASLASRQK